MIKDLIEKDDKLHLAIFEALGCLVLMNHWMRGILDKLVQQDVVQLTENEKESWNRVISKLSHYEQVVWEIAPSRLILHELRRYRQTGKIQEDQIDLMLKKDSHGRIPYGLTPGELENIETILKKLKDAREIPYGHGYGLLGGDSGSY